jgi:hypothetical protein
LKKDNVFWLQLDGRAMGTPASPLYSILTFGQHENSQILNTFKNNTLFSVLQAIY